MTYRNILTLDFETYFDKDYTLKKMATSLYIKDKRFKMHSVVVKYNDGIPQSFTEPEEFQEHLDQYDWEDTAVLCHHTQFDGLILAHHFNTVPGYYLDTLSMARALYGMQTEVSLDKICKFLGLPYKSDDVSFFAGKQTLTVEEMERLLIYNTNDVNITYSLFQRLVTNYPQDELDLIDLTVRMFTQPGFLIDVPRAQAELDLELENKAGAMMRSNLTKEILSSTGEFGAWLAQQGIKVPMKDSPKRLDSDGKPLRVHAFAKTDVEFTKLLEHENDLVRFAVEARLSTKSTSNSSRAERFVMEGSLGPLPVYLSYYGAHTGRWSGGNRINLQNLKRGGELRKCLIAPPGYVIGVVDSGQIECRVNAWLSGESTLLDCFKRYDTGDKSYDPYRRMATLAYRTPIESINTEQRFVGKIAVLGLGYQMGAPKYQSTLESGAMGMKVLIPLTEAYDIVKTYRADNKNIVGMWERCEDILREMVTEEKSGGIGSYKVISWRNKKIYLPNGMYLDFPHLTCTEELGFIFDTQRGYKKIYGGLLLENIVQALARIIVSTQMQMIASRFKVLTMTHDEVVALLPEATAQEDWEFMHKCMTTTPDWCSDLPLSAEGGWSKEYSK